MFSVNCVTKCVTSNFAEVRGSFPALVLEEEVGSWVTAGAGTCDSRDLLSLVSVGGNP